MQRQVALRRMQHQNGAIAGHKSPYAMSGGGGYALALVPRDRVDYSVSKGGLRQWAVLFVFIVLCSSLYTVFNVNKIDLNIPVDLDGDGDIDNDVGDGDADDDNDALHGDKKLEKEKDERETPSRSIGEKLTAAAGDRDKQRRNKSTDNLTSSNNDDDAADADDDRHDEVVDDSRVNFSDDDEGDDDDDDDEADPAPTVITPPEKKEPSKPTKLKETEEDSKSVPKKSTRKHQSKKQNEPTDEGEDEEDEDDEDQDEARAKEELLLRALKEKAEARRQERQEKRATKKAARQAAREQAARRDLDGGPDDDEEDGDADDDDDDQDQKKPEPRKPRTGRKVRSQDRRQDKEQNVVEEEIYEKKESSPKMPEPEPESQEDEEKEGDDDEAKEEDDSPKPRRRQIRRGRKSDEQPDEPISVRYVRKKGKKHQQPMEDQPDDNQATTSQENSEYAEDQDGEGEGETSKPTLKRHRKSVNIIEDDLSAPDESEDLFDQRSIRLEKRKKKKMLLKNAAETSEGADDDKGDRDIEEQESPKEPIVIRHRKSVNIIEDDLSAPDESEDLFDQRSIRLEKRKKKKMLLKNAAETSESADDDKGDWDLEEQESPKEPIVIRYTRTKGKLPKKPKKKLPKLEDGVQETNNEDATDQPSTSGLSDGQESERRQIGPIRYKRTRGHYKRPSNADREREAVTVDIPAAEADIDDEKPEHCSIVDTDQDCKDQTVPIEVRYFRTKGKLLPKKQQRKPVEEDEKKEEEEEEAENLEEDDDEDDEDGNEEEDDDENEEFVDEDKEKESEKSTVPSLKVRYRKHEITNEADNLIRDVLDVGDKLIEDERKYEAARDHFSSLLNTLPESPRINYGYARALDRLSETEQSNDILEDCIEAYEKVLDLPGVPETLYHKVLDRLVDRSRFRGWPQKAVSAQRKAVDRFPNNYDIRNQYGLTFLLMGRNQDAKRVFQEVLNDDGENGFAQMHYGFILKTIDDDPEGAVKYMSKGMASGAEGTDHPRFYFHLGDALQRTGKKHQAYKLYDEGASRGYFLSRLQRSLYNCDGLTGRPWWTLRQTGVQEQLEELEKHWQTIRAEGLALLDSKEQFFRSEDEKLTNSGDWKQFTLFQRGKKVENNCARAPKTCALIEQFPEAANCRRGQVKFSIMSGGTRVHPHCGPTNCRIRAHLGLAIPIEPRIRVANETRNWKLGKFIVLDDSFEHEVWHDGSLPRLILIVDFWHPQVTTAQRNSLSAI